MTTTADDRDAGYVLTLEEIGNLTREAGKPAETLMNVVALIASHFHTDVCSAYLLEPDRATLVLRPGFAFVRGTLDLEMNVVERQEPTSARLVLNSKGIGSSSEVEASLAIAAIENGSRLHWIAEVKSLGGLLKMVPGGLIRGAAQKVIGDALDAIGGKLEGAKT